MGDIGLIIVFILLGIVLIVGCIAMFGYATESGFIGFAIFVAAWIFLAPVTAVICFFYGALITLRAISDN